MYTVNPNAVTRKVHTWEGFIYSGCQQGNEKYRI